MEHEFEGKPQGLSPMSPASTRPAALDLAADNAQWLGLEVKKHMPGSADRATVEFVARYKIGGRAHRMHEISSFVREEGRWFYMDGEFPG